MLEIKNYREFRKELNIYLDKNPIVKYSTFKKKAIKILFKFFRTIIKFAF